MPNNDPITRIFASSKSDNVYETGDPVDYVDIWYRRDLGELRMRVDGKVLTLFRQGKIANEALPNELQK